MLLTQLQYFVALAREEHFGRAAAACFVSPSTLSEAVRKLEVELGVPLVRRGHAFEGLTPEGEMALTWARRVVSDQEALSAEIAAARGQLTGVARIGTIPAGIALATAVVSALADAHPLVRSTVQSGLNSEDVVARLRAFELDAGIIHPSAADGPDLVSVPLGEVTNVVVAAPGMFPEDQASITGRMLSEVPLGLLASDMRARQLADEAWRAAGLQIKPRLEADSNEALLSLVTSGLWAAVVPETAVAARRDDPSIHVLPLIEPEVSTPLAVVRLPGKPAPVLVRALGAAAQTVLKDPRRAAQARRSRNGSAVHA
ncbi:DNA-binding transcriptional LysR family regulator [Arthrobacter woluwensis]|uniref:LysR family transcriptional regulator n=1 Tax=Arthrobacter woluwensis TaxID=156980 RepID=UPI002782C690|nr:LysR family transcriptional regulator [Arthrobacter woluwensis]MDQ0710149.1 DNA-binding transcriptional LysR family regulator [Arthrobacter woluwensis]